MIRAYHFVGKTLRDGSPIPADGEWLRVKGPIEICETGLHASRHVADALKFAPGNTLCLVDMSRDIAKQSDKLVARCRRIVARFDATDLLRAEARASALSVAHLWDMPPIVRQYLETGDEALRPQAADAAAAAAHAASAAAYDASYTGASYAASYTGASYAAAAAAAAAADAAYAAAAADAAYAAAAYAATRAAAHAATRAAAYAADAYAAGASYAATRAASRKASRKRLQDAVDAKFKEILG